jgi:predicted cupin superfamily sugar epimerase
VDGAEIIDSLGLIPHPEGGWYRETWRSSLRVGEGPTGPRSAGTAIYFLLLEGEQSAWHRVDAAECWHHYAGSALDLWIAEDDQPSRRVVLGVDLAAGERPQQVVPAGAWQSAAPRGAFTLVGCTVVPGFEFDGLELAPAGWRPGASAAAGPTTDAP